MKRWKKILPILFIVASFFAGSSYAESIINMSVSPGYEGVLVTGTVVPIEVELKSTGADIQGKLKVSYRNDDTEVYVATELPIQLIKGSAKKYVVPLTIEQDVYTYQEDQFLTVEVFNQSGKLLKNQVVGVSKITRNDEVIAGVMSDKYVGFTYFNLAKVQLNDGDTRSINTLKMNVTHFEEARFLDGLDVLVVDGVDETVSDQGLVNIKQWVQNGGVLILSTGEQYGTQGQFHEVFEIKESEELAVDSLGDLNNITQITITDPTFIESLNQEGIYSKAYGSGRIVMTSYSLSGKQIVESTTNTQVIATLIQNEVIDKGYKEEVDQNDFRGLKNILNSVPREQMPSIKIIMTIISMYVLIVGPVGYLILKQKNLTTYYWRLVGGIAVLATLIIFIAGRGIDFNKTIANGLTIIDQRNEQTQATSFLGIKYSGIGDVDIALESGLIKWSGSYAYGESPKNKTYYLKDDRQHVVFEDVKKFQFLNMMVENNLDISNSQQNIILSNNMTEVTVSNPFDHPLTDVVVLMNGMSNYIERIEANEMITVEIDATAFSQSGRRWNSYEFYDTIDTKIEGIYEKNRIIDSFFQREQNGRLNVDGAMMVFGFIESESTQAIEINDKKVAVLGNSFWVDTLDLGKPSAGEVKLPYGAIVPSVNLHGETYYDDYDQSYYGYGEAEFTFALPTWIEESQVMMSFDDRSGLVYKLYNNQSELWEDVYFTDGNYEPLLSNDQLSEENVIRLMVINNSGDNFDSPLLEAKGVVKND